MTTITRKLGVGASYLFLLAAFVGTAHAGVSSVAGVPEVDPGSMGAAAVLLVGGYLVLVSRFRSK